MWWRRRDWNGGIRQRAPYRATPFPDLREAYRRRTVPPAETLVQELATHMRHAYAREAADAAGGWQTDPEWFARYAAKILVQWGLIEPTGEDDSDE